MLLVRELDVSGNTDSYELCLSPKTGASSGHAVFVIGYAYEHWYYQYTITYPDGTTSGFTEYEFYEWDLVLDPEGDGTVSNILAREYKRDANGNTTDNSYPGMDEVSTYTY